MGAMNGLLKTRFVAALLTFCLVAAVAGYFRLGNSAPQDFPYLSWTGWTISDFLRQPRPNLVFLGSSLMLVPLDGVDADYLKRRVDGSQHHHSSYFEDKLKQITGLNLRTFNFALPGEMPSDGYLIVKNLLYGEKKPDLIVYGLGPRDFLDNMLPYPSATDPFRFLSRFGDISSIAARVMPDWLQQMDFDLGKACYFYGHRVDLSTGSLRGANAVLDKIVPLPGKMPSISLDDRRLIMPDFRPCQILPGQAWFRPSTAADRAVFVDNLAEYRKRYATMKWDTYISQMRFFADTLNTAHERGIKVVVVTMPVTQLNRGLLSDLSWEAYRKGVIAMARRKGATVLDFSESAEFCQSDFGDTVHLHAGGGKRLFDLILARFSQDNSVLTALRGGRSGIKPAIADDNLRSGQDTRAPGEERHFAHLKQRHQRDLAERGKRL